MKTVVIIPTYNEAENIKSIISDVLNAISYATILVVDDNSPDGTAEHVRKIMRTEPRVSLFLRMKKEGLGRAYLDAFKKILQNQEI